MMTCKKLRNIRKVKEYAQQYMDYCIERDGIAKWQEWDEGWYWFKEMCANANMPVFDPLGECGIEDDPCGELYDTAVAEAWRTLQLALGEYDPVFK